MQELRVLVDVADDGRSGDTSVMDVMNICVNAELVARGALARKESRGSHFRSDYPASDPNWLKRICLRRRSDSSTDVSFIALRFHRLYPPELAEPVASPQMSS